MKGCGTRHISLPVSHAMTSLVPNLSVAMELRQTNQAELCRKLGWSEAKLSRLMNGKQKGVTVAQLKELESALGMSLAFLMDIEDVAQTADEKELLAGYRLAHPRDKEMAKSAVKPRD